MDAYQVINNIVTKTVDLLTPSNPKALILGISGGLDSAVVAALGQKVAHKLEISLYGWVLPIYQKPNETLAGSKISQQFCHYWGIQDLTQAFKTFKTQMRTGVRQLSVGDTATIYGTDYFPAAHSELRGYKSLAEDSICDGNMRARIRMIFLYEMARRLGGPVLGTDNLSEYLTGFWTLHGDVGDVGMIQNVFKGLELTEIAKYLRIPSWCIDQTPTDGLGISDSDEDQLGGTYLKVDRILIQELAGEYNETGPSIHQAIKRYRDPVITAKRNNPQNLTREEIGLPPIEYLAHKEKVVPA